MKVFINNFMKYRFLLKELVKKGIKLKYRRSYLGILWTLIEPLLTMLVLTFVFGSFIGKGDATYPIYILTGRLLYGFFSSGTNAALKSIRNNSAMIKKVYVPKYMYPLSGILFNYVIFLISLIVLIGTCVVLGVEPTWHILQAIFPLLNVLLLTFGIGMILSAFAVFFRDLEYLWSVALMLIMYASAIFYYPKNIASGSRWIFEINPLYACIENFRNAIFGQHMNLHALAFSFGSSIVAIGLGMFIFYKKQDDFILNI